MKIFLFGLLLLSCNLIAGHKKNIIKVDSEKFSDCMIIEYNDIETRKYNAEDESHANEYYYLTGIQHGMIKTTMIMDDCSISK